MSINEYLCKQFEKDEDGNVKLWTILQSEAIHLLFIATCVLFALSLCFSIDEIERLYGIDKNIDIFYVFFILIPTNMMYITITIIGVSISFWVLGELVIKPMFKYILIPILKIKYKINNITVAKCKIKKEWLD